MLFYLPVILMIVGTMTYHIAQKSVPGSVNPVFSLIINYVSALAGTLLLIPLYPSRTAGFLESKKCELGERRGWGVDRGSRTGGPACVPQRMAREFAFCNWK